MLDTIGAYKKTYVNWWRESRYLFFGRHFFDIQLFVVFITV